MNKSKNATKVPKKVLLLGNIKGDGLKSMELVKKEYEKNYAYAKVLTPELFVSRRFTRLILYPIIAFFHRGYDVYPVSYTHLTLPTSG